MYQYYGILLMLSFHLFDVKMSHANSILPWSIFLNLQTYYEWWSVYFFHEFHFCHVNGTLSQEKKGLSWSWSYGSWNYNHLWNQCLRSYKVVSSNPVHCEVYSMQHYVIKFVSDLRQVSGFLRVLRFPPPIELTVTI